MSIFGALGLDEGKAQEANLSVDLDEGGVLAGTYGVKDPSDKALAAEYENDPLYMDPEEDAKDGAPTDNEREYCLWSAAREFYKLPHTIIVFDKARNANCHGHTMHPGRLAWVDGSVMEEAIKSGHVTANCCLFYRGDDLAHSGIIDGGKLVHRLIHVGVLVSEIGGSTCGYTKRFVLPGDGEALIAFIETREKAAAEREALIEQAEEVRSNVDAINQYVTNALKALSTYGETHDVEALLTLHPDLKDGTALGQETGVAANALYADTPDISYIARVPEYIERYKRFKAAAEQIEDGEAITNCLGELYD